jgi:hypothetical protein
MIDMVVKRASTLVACLLGRVHVIWSASSADMGGKFSLS